MNKSKSDVIAMERGKNYRINYRIPGEREKQMIATFLSEDDDTYVFSGRPYFGTTPVRKERVLKIEETTSLPMVPKTVPR